jgi:tRNA(Arg) A34 adenosine deaminase TadA
MEDPQLEHCERRHWLETHESCPYCRYTLLHFRITEQAFDAEEEEAAAKSRAIPDWVITLLGSNLPDLTGQEDRMTE